MSPEKEPHTGSELPHESQAMGVISYNDENVVCHIIGDSPAAKVVFVGCTSAGHYGSRRCNVILARFKIEYVIL